MERVQKILSAGGVASRRKAEELILNKKVLVNGKIAKLGDKVNPSKDKIQVNGKKIRLEQKKIYYIVNKPKGYVCSNKKQSKQDKLVIDLVSEKNVWAVGRLDKDSTGLVLLTNDGELTQRYTHPKFEHKKEYEVVVNKEIDKNFLLAMQKGIMLREGLAKADKIGKINKNKFKITLHQGWNRQIRRMCGKLEVGVIDLKRTKIGKIGLGNLKEGEWKKINKI